MPMRMIIVLKYALFMSSFLVYTHTHLRSTFVQRKRLSQMQERQSGSKSIFGFFPIYLLWDLSLKGI